MNNPFKSKIPEEERKAIIDAYKNGTLDNTKYEVHPYKKNPNKFYIHKITEDSGEIKNNLPNNLVSNTNNTNNNISNNNDNNENIEIYDDTNNNNNEEYNPFNDPRMYYPKSKMTKANLFREMQMMMNSMFLEQFKLLRKDNKFSEKKRKKLADKTNAMYRSISNFVAEPDEENKNEIVEIKEETTPPPQTIPPTQPPQPPLIPTPTPTPIPPPNNIPITTSGFKQRVFNPV
ncbi:MAG: hypothetical protein LBR15_00585 [Methanobrevibacter sp.]|jgi:hypothetical protein|nr:hypothetical protein [Candidatus Methanovirga australis]